MGIEMHRTEWMFVVITWVVASQSWFDARDCHSKIEALTRRIAMFKTFTTVDRFEVSINLNQIESEELVTGETTRIKMASGAIYVVQCPVDKIMDMTPEPKI